MTEREEFELVAKAAGYKYEWLVDYYFAEGPHLLIGDNIDDEFDWGYWNPKTDDGDCLRLAVDLGIEVSVLNNVAMASTFYKQEYLETVKPYKDHPDKYDAVRAAVWDVAVEVAKRRMEK